MCLWDVEDIVFEDHCWFGGVIFFGAGFFEPDIVFVHPSAVDKYLENVVECFFCFVFDAALELCIEAHCVSSCCMSCLIIPVME